MTTGPGRPSRRTVLKTLATSVLADRLRAEERPESPTDEAEENDDAFVYGAARYGSD